MLGFLRMLLNTLIVVLSIHQGKGHGLNYLYSNCKDFPGCEYLYGNESILRTALLEDYDPYVAPRISYLGDPLIGNTYIALNIFKVVDLDIITANLDFMAGLTLEWNDPRLVWDPEVNGVDKTTFVPAGDSIQIWSPPIKIYNSIIPMFGNEPGLAVVYPDGRVLWDRLGRVNFVCNFQGVYKFPFDTPKCTGNFGYFPANFNDLGNIKWATGSQCSHADFFNGSNGIVYGYGDEVDPNEFSTYQEFKVVMDETETKDMLRMSPTSATASATFKVSRSAKFYVKKILTPMITLCYLSFGTFFIDVRIGERLGLGITVLLAMFAVDGLTSVYLPICRESIWMNYVVAISIEFATMAMFESLLVVWLHHYHQEQADKYKEKEEKHDLEIRSLKAGLPVVKIPQVEAETNRRWSYYIFGSRKEGESVQRETSSSDDEHADDETTQAARESMEAKMKERQNYLERRNLHEGNIKKSKLVDRWSIYIFPPAYTIILIIFFLNPSIVQGNSG